MVSDTTGPGVSTDTDKLRRLAEQATAAPWYLDGDAETEGYLFVGNRADGRTHGLWEIVHMTSEKMGGGQLGELTPEARTRRLADAAFIAAANPAAVIELLDRVEKLEAENAQVRALVDPWRCECVEAPGGDELVTYQCKRCALLSILNPKGQVMPV